MKRCHRTATPRRLVLKVMLWSLGGVLLPSLATAQEAEAESQSRESMANDATAAQWTLQVAYEVRDWYEDEVANGGTRPPGNKNMWQFRLVAPLPKEKTGLGFTILNRLTFRNNETVHGTSGSGNAEFFAMAIPLEWATGRVGIGPQIDFPASDAQFGSKEWRYGFASAVLQRAASDKILTGLLIQQLWGTTDIQHPSSVVASPITIQPIFNYSLPRGFYLNIGETALSYDWHNEVWLIPVGVRLGKLWVGDRTTWNLYGEYRTSVVYEDWKGSAVKDAFRVNVSYTIPM